jgi:beta-barrel assembly-enhancing protease
MSMPAPRRLGRAVRALLDRARPLGLLVLLSFAAGCVDEEQEQQLGDAIAADINAQVPLVLDPFTVGYVNRIGQHIADQSERPDVPYRFYVVNTAMVNAFALPGGHIYVTRGLIARTRNVAELSAVLAHEIGHVAARHGAQALQRELRTGSVVSMLYEIFLGVEPAILEQRALTIGGRLWFATHSRRAEREADRLALRYMIRSGIDPEGMLTMLEGLIEDELEAPQ